MNFYYEPNELDKTLAASLSDFIPNKIYDAHLHFSRVEHFSKGTRAGAWPDRIDCRDWKEILNNFDIFKGKTIAGLPFGTPSTDSDRVAINEYIYEQHKEIGHPASRCLFLASPEDNPEIVAEALRSRKFSGVKVYHFYAIERRPILSEDLTGREILTRTAKETFHASISEYAPEWMWEILNEYGGSLMLHMVLDTAIADERNQKEIIRLCTKYPRTQLIMAHAARCFGHRHSLRGLHTVAHLPNVWIDTSAVCEAESFSNALRVLEPQRILYGSDFPVSQFRGRCVTMGDSFVWYHPEPGKEAINNKMTLVGIESLIALREAVERFGGTQQDIEDIFWNNAMRCLNIPAEDSGVDTTPRTGHEAWAAAKEVISCGTGLLSKRAESFLTPKWPTYFNKAAGCRIWDADGNMWIDFVGGVGAVLLGYGDPDVNKAVSRRLTQGSYCSLLAEEEVQLAKRLIELHPGMGKVRYARGGGEAMGLSVRVARAAKGKSGIAFCGYHGWQDWYLAANVGYENPADYPVPGLNPAGVPVELKGTVQTFHFNDIDSLKTAVEKLGNNFAAIVMEPMRRENPAPEFIQAVQGIAKQNNALLVIDEVSSGLRFGFPGVSSSLGYDPDIVVYAKAMSNGIPFGVIVGKEEVMDAAAPSFISSSYWTDGLGAAAALAVLEKMEREDIQPKLWKKGIAFREQLINLIAKHPTLKLTVEGAPVAPRIIFDAAEDAKAVRMRLTEEMMKRGFLTSGLFYLMHAHSAEDISIMFAALDESLAIVAKEAESGALKDAKVQQAVTIGRLA